MEKVKGNLQSSQVLVKHRYKIVLLSLLFLWNSEYLKFCSVLNNFLWYISISIDLLVITLICKFMFICLDRVCHLNCHLKNCNLQTLQNKHTCNNIKQLCILFIFILVKSCPFSIVYWLFFFTCLDAILFFSFV